MDAPLHIASFIVHARPEQLDAVLANLRLLDDLDVHQHSREGKAVVVIEAVDEKLILQRIDQVNALPGVLNAALIYHECLTSEGAAR
ncbi:periplasmic nitrate reductase chaperone NapD [Pseudomonas sp. URMO17WK12:I1]|uniref:chaperone NapD n=1 Tax=unclassified Pseudomonas TaxID=196821 RepID=UPI000487D7F0|nr:MULTISPECIES: chaperone NapD [unclassified Pseudomonas]PZW69781.1 periplasmic nitrate reductase chaperone NapD [Pseudomonas sp. URMO17WK12:I1]